VIIYYHLAKTEILVKMFIKLFRKLGFMSDLEDRVNELEPTDFKASIPEIVYGMGIDSLASVGNAVKNSVKWAGKGLGYMVIGYFPEDK